MPLQQRRAHIELATNNTEWTLTSGWGNRYIYIYKYMPGWNRELIRKKKITRWKEGRKERGDGRQKREKERDRYIALLGCARA